MIRGLLYKAFSLLGSREAARFKAACEEPREQQLARMTEIIAANAKTEYGRKHNFAQIKSASDFQRAVPINDYDSLNPFIEKVVRGEENILTAEKPFMFATTSGTSGNRKYIPVTKAYMKEFRRASVVSGYNTFRAFPQMANGVSLSVFSSAQEGLTKGNLPYGAISGRLYLEEPALIKRHITPIPYEVLTIEDYEARYYTLLRCALMTPVSFLYTLNPSTIMLLGKKLAVYAEPLIRDIVDGTIRPPETIGAAANEAVKPFLRRDPELAARLTKLFETGRFTPQEIWPNLAVICCWTKAAAAYYLQDFPQFYGETPICDITYGASEGRGTVLLEPNKQALAVRSHFYEFIEPDDLEKGVQNAKIADELEVGKEYYILFTTGGGLYRYNLQDIVKVVGWYGKTPLLEFMHKGGNISSFTGEKITETQAIQAANHALSEVGSAATFFTVVPEFRPLPHYQLWVEPKASIDETRLAGAFDAGLRIANSEYETKRDSQRLADPTVKTLPSGTYERLRRTLVNKGVPDAQIKISHLNPKAEIREELLAGTGAIGTS